MRVVSLNVGLPREVQWHGQTVRTSIFKAPVDAENQELLHRATQSSTLPESWKDYFRKRLWEPDS